jgi:hypothetical protein
MSTEPTKAELPSPLPPFPWDWIASATPTANGQFAVYLVDAKGRKLAAIWGKGAEREAIAKLIVTAANDFAGSRIVGTLTHGQETIKTLLDLLNPLHGSLDEQVTEQFTDERELDPPKDREYAVNVTRQMERDLTQAVCILENRLRDPAGG